MNWTAPATPPLGEGANQPSLSEMTLKAIDLLSKNSELATS